MKLHFFGTGSGFAESHTNAYFFYGKDLVLIDMSMNHVRKAVSLAEEKNPENIFLLLTHLHPDHVSGVSMLCQFLYYTRNKTRLKIMIRMRLLTELWVFWMLNVQTVICMRSYQEKERCRSRGHGFIKSFQPSIPRSWKESVLDTC